VILFGGTALLAQPPGSANPSRDVPVVKQVGPEEVRRLGDRLRSLQGGSSFPPELFKQFQKVIDENPNASEGEIARKLGELDPRWKDPRTFMGLKDHLDKNGQMPAGQLPDKGGNRPPGSTPLPNIKPPSFDPKQPPIGVPPSPPTDFPPGTNPPGSNKPPPGGDPDNSRQPPPPTRGPPTPRPIDSPQNLRAKSDPGQAGKQDRQFKAAVGAWEESFGPLNDSPAVKQLLYEIITGQDGSGQNNGGLGDLIGDGTGDGKAVENMLDNSNDSSSFKFSDIGLSKWDFGGSDSSSSSSSRSSYSSGSSSSSGGFGSFGEGSWMPVILFFGVLGGALVLWWLWPKLMGVSVEPKPIAGLGPWPVDPRTIADRAALVKAFEYLSLLLCGEDARTWNHLIIAAAFREKLPHAEALAEPLAWYYALARYTPAGEPLPSATITQAREYLCELAGVSPV